MLMGLQGRQEAPTGSSHPRRGRRQGGGPAVHHSIRVIRHSPGTPLGVSRFRRPHVLFPGRQGSGNKFVQCNAERATENHHFEIGYASIAGFDLGDCGPAHVESSNAAPGSQFVLAQAGRLPTPPHLGAHDVSGVPGLHLADGSRAGGLKRYASVTLGIALRWKAVGMFP